MFLLITVIGIVSAGTGALQAEANAISAKGQALRENPEVLTLTQIEQWNGVLPRIMSGEDAGFGLLIQDQGK